MNVIHRTALVVMLFIVLTLVIYNDPAAEITGKMIKMFMLFGLIFIILPREKDGR